MCYSAKNHSLSSKHTNVYFPFFCTQYYTKIWSNHSSIWYLLSKKYVFEAFPYLFLQLLSPPSNYNIQVNKESLGASI